MGLIVIGVDEAGYGPLLGPMCVGMAAVRVRQWSPGWPSPDFWSLMSRSVCRSVAEASPRKGGRIAIADSKELKLPNDVAGAGEASGGLLRGQKRHPTMHLERGVLAFLRSLGVEVPRTDVDALHALSGCWPAHACYSGEPIGLPLGWTPEQLSIACGMLAGELDRAGLEPLALKCRVIAEDEFNTVVRASGNKASVTAGAVGEWVRLAWSSWAAGSDAVWFVCDRLGGRAAYADLLRACLEADTPGLEVQVVDETDRRSRYTLAGGGRKMGVTFVTEGESCHLPVALASMTAKYVRELAMARFNRFWCARLAELKPTAGYREDGGRWLRQASELLTPMDRQSLVRIV